MVRKKKVSDRNPCRYCGDKLWTHPRCATCGRFVWCNDEVKGRVSRRRHRTCWSSAVSA